MPNRRSRKILEDSKPTQATKGRPEGESKCGGSKGKHNFEPKYDACLSSGQINTPAVEPANLLVNHADCKIGTNVESQPSNSISDKDTAAIIRSLTNSDGMPPYFCKYTGVYYQKTTTQNSYHRMESFPATPKPKSTVKEFSRGPKGPCTCRFCLMRTGSNPARRYFCSEEEYIFGGLSSGGSRDEGKCGFCSDQEKYGFFRDEIEQDLSLC